MHATFTRLLSALARAQHERPQSFALAAALISVAAMPSVLQLELNSDFQALLPQSSRSVRDLDEIRERFGGTATLTLAIQDTRGEGADRAELRTFTRALAQDLEHLEGHSIAQIDWNVADFYDFVRANQHLYADLGDLTEIRDALQARLDWERAHANPFYLDLENAEPPDPQATLDRIRDDAEEAEHEMERFPEGFYQHAEEPITFIFIRTSIRGGESGATDRLLLAVEAATERALAATGHAAPSASRGHGSDAGIVAAPLRVDFGGEIMDVREENEALREAVERSTAVTLVLLLISIYVFFLSWRAIPLLAATLIAPCLLAFGLAEPIVDNLNASSAFLASIVIGNGVNSSIMWLGRYFEERRHGKTGAEAIEATHLGTWQGTLAAALAAALAYGSLTVTDYRGFRDFGFIGFLGMALCWLGAYAFLPAFATLAERISPMKFAPEDRDKKGVYGVLFARLSLASPRAMLVASGILTVVTTVAIVFAVQHDPLEYDFRNLQAIRPNESRVSWVNERVGVTVNETQSGSAVAILAPTNADVPHLVEELVAYRTENPTAFGDVRTIDDILPSDQDQKIPLLADLRRVLLEARPYLTEAQQAEVDDHLPPEHIESVDLDDLPVSVARSFTERDGSRGRLVFVEHADGRSTWDGRYQIEWARGARSATALDGTEPPVAGTAVVFADLISSIFSEAPIAIGASLCATLMLLLLSFRGMRERGYALIAMLVGVSWMTGILALMQVKLNFLNMVAFPITFGIGLEYSVNYMKRYREERDLGKQPAEAVRASLEGAGGAVVLCSLTTLIGYISLYASSNRALNSFGLAMSIGEITCLLSSVLALPALLVAIEERGRAHTPGATTATEGNRVSKPEASE